MKISYIIALVVIAVAVGVIISTAGDTSAYVTFNEAIEMAQKGNNNKVHVIGELRRDEQGNIVGMQYNPALDPNYFVFRLIDEKGKEQEVVYRSPKPQDFERSEKIVIIGSMQQNQFVADKILMKCPSKYQETEIKEASGAAM